MLLLTGTTLQLRQRNGELRGNMLVGVGTKDQRVDWRHVFMGMHGPATPPSGNSSDLPHVAVTNAPTAEAAARCQCDARRWMLRHALHWPVPLKGSRRQLAPPLEPVTW